MLLVVVIILLEMSFRAWFSVSQDGFWMQCLPVTPLSSYLPIDGVRGLVLVAIFSLHQIC